ncbi:hypothetical protein [uncultured Tessaracoccus sp.]|uniref:hypothetical protein n=1 Tax=uncultured Tessaracoccus sp. TaxID=905023 RepID=UPI00261A81D4|nr:hypothetical protein [uncultured Tessaracoccus sp.]
MNDIVTAGLIVWVAMAIPAIVHGLVLAKRSGKSLVLAVIACLLLPWLGLLFFIDGRPVGTRKVMGLGHYCISMYVVAAFMAIISIFPNWVVGDPNYLGGVDGYAPRDSIVLAIIIAALALALIAGAVGIRRGGDLSVAIVMGIIISLAAGMLAALVHLWGQAGLFNSDLRDAQDRVAAHLNVGPGGWIALIALIVAYVCTVLLPLGLRVEAAPEPPSSITQPPQGYSMPDPGAPGGAAQQGWAPPQQQWPTNTGAGW